MDNIDITQQIDAALEALPKEVKNFLYKGAFEEAVTSIATTFFLSEQQKDELDYCLTQIVALLQHRNAIENLSIKWNFSSDQKERFMEEVEKKIFIPIIQATNYVEEDELTTVAAPSPQEMLESLKNRLVQPTAIAPSTRQHESVSDIVKKDTPSAPRIDPYREIPK